MALPSSNGTTDPAQAPGQNLAMRLARLHAQLVRDGYPLADMRRAQALELVFAGASDIGGERSRFRSVEIERLEAPFDVRPVHPAPPGTSRLRYFLDGTQYTRLVWRVGVVPITLTVAAAAVLVRDEAGHASVLPGTLRLAHALLIPREAPDPDLRNLARVLEQHDYTVLDPLADDCRSDADYGDACDDYDRLHAAAYRTARQLRADLENATLRWWAEQPERATDDGWLVVDGRLNAPFPRTIGLVKQFTERHLTGAETATLFSLPQGHRTTAFAPRDRRRDPGPAASPDLSDPHANTLWYLRLWDAAGQDARHALVRVEAGPAVRSTAQIDELSAWLLAERTPRAVADSRWATLLYPVHYLELILKRRLASEMRGWPGGR